MLKILRKNKGQAVFELIVVVPIFVFLYSVIIIFGSAINASINQQKSVRNSFFNQWVFNNSFLPPVANVVNLVDYEKTGLFAVTWADKIIDESPYAPCFPLISGLTEGNEDCDKKRSDKNYSAFVKVFTSFGMCSANYLKVGNEVFREMRGGNSGWCINK